jgi:hypothetical protein
MWQVVCDRCGNQDDGSDYEAWADADQAISAAEDGDWLVVEEAHYCPGCCEWDEDEDELVPKPPLADARKVAP